jgi:FMN phosphatase YigB (HAD superfamily)
MLIFDFDGVLMNSLDEVALTTYNAATGSLLTSMAEIPLSPVELFKSNRFHVQQIGDAVTLMNWCRENRQNDLKRILTREEYRNVVAGADSELIDRTNLIYETRRRLIEADSKRWLAMHHPYHPLWKELVNRREFSFVILTNKNHDATLRLCRHFGLDIDAGDIYSGDNGVTKTENMGRIRDRFGREKYSFIDDSVKNLKALDVDFNTEKKALSLLLAAWGYTGDGDAEIATEAGYAVVSQTDVIELLDSGILDS